MKSVHSVLLSLSLAIAASAHAGLKLNGLFTDNAVLQQKRDIPVWGTGRDGEKVTVKLGKDQASTTVRDGHWMVTLKPLNAGGPFTLAVSGDNSITLTNILIGEVWLCSGQSNMGFGLYRATNAAEAIAAADDPALRLFTVPYTPAGAPIKDITGHWQASSPASVSNFSAVAYFFGRDLRRALKAPIGLIHSSVGGTPAEAWTPHETLESDPELEKILERQAENARKFDPEKAKAQYDRSMEKYREAAKAAEAEGKPAPRAPRRPVDPAKTGKRPSALYNGMIAPLEPYGIAGVIWYQGEANAGRAEEYESLFPAMIKGWRNAWHEGEFPFLFVQIAPNDRMTPEIREAQLHTWQKVPKTAMTLTVDVGEPHDIHPKRKEPVGARLALAARAIAYGEKIEYSGPVFEKMQIDGDHAVLSFSHIDGGLTAKGGPLKGFTISADGQTFYPATATITGDKIEVSSKEVSKPVAVRYGWDNVPDVNLFNKEGLPATPFRTK